MKKTNFRLLFASLALSAVMLLLPGCDSVGDENPISPEDMEARRQQDANARANFTPSDAAQTKPGN